MGQEWAKDNAYYDVSENRIVLGKNMLEDEEILLWTYMSIALTGSVETSIYQSVASNSAFRSLEMGLKEYFTCSFIGDSFLGEKSAKKVYGKAGGQVL